MRMKRKSLNVSCASEHVRTHAWKRNGSYKITNKHHCRTGCIIPPEVFYCAESTNFCVVFPCSLARLGTCGRVDKAYSRDSKSSAAEEALYQCKSPRTGFMLSIHAIPDPERAEHLGSSAGSIFLPICEDPGTDRIVHS